MDKFFKRVFKTEACWYWTGYIDQEGYGRTSVVTGKQERSHRLAYTALVGQIPSDLVTDHLCGVRACVNPDHMELVTRGENARRGLNANRFKTHCKREHEFTLENTFIDRRGRRRCRTCMRRQGRITYHKTKS